MKISIIIPTYKPQDWFDECIESIYNQTFPHSDFEVIIILNGDLSYDDYVKSVMSKYSNSLNLVYFTSEIGSVSNARNIGLDNAIGDYILFIDSDDVISSNYIDSIYKVSTNTTVGVSMCEKFEYQIDNSFKTAELERKESNVINYPMSLYENHYVFSNAWCKCISRGVVGDTKFDTKFMLGEDGLFMLSISSKIKQLALADKECVYYIRQTDNSLSRKKFSRIYIYKLMLRRIFSILHIYVCVSRGRNIKLFIRKIISTINIVNRADF